MTPEIDRLLERLRQRRDQRAAQLATDADGVARSRGLTGTAPAIGARVFDPVVGQEGVIIARTSENVVVPTSRRADR